MGQLAALFRNKQSKTLLRCAGKEAESPGGTEPRSQIAALERERVFVGVDPRQKVL
jgi:hypothetical protein